jgi:hypothetical protein
MTDKIVSDISREHIDWLTNELLITRKQLKERNQLMSELLDPELYGWSVPQEIRSRIYNLFSVDRETDNNAYNRK